MMVRFWGLEFAVMGNSNPARESDQSRYTKTSSSDLTITPLRIDTDTRNNPK
jgi:hypothetical protein